MSPRLGFPGRKSVRIHGGVHVLGGDKLGKSQPNRQIPLLISRNAGMRRIVGGWQVLNGQ